MVDDVVSWGVTPLLTAMDGDNAPTNNSFPVPELAVPIPTCVMVEDPPVHAGNETFAVGETPLAVTVHPPEVLATATRAYDVYVVSFVD